MLKRLAFVCVLLASIAASASREKWQGYCQNGGSQDVIGGLTSAKYFMQNFPSCTVTVYLTGTQTLATLYSDNSGTPLANPFTASNTGLWAFYSDNARYDIRMSGGGITSPFTLSDILLYDPNQFVTLQAAITTVCNAGGGVVYVPTGTYTQTAAITLCSNLHLYGDGAGTSIIAFAPSTNISDLLVAASFSNIEIDHLKITGTSKTARLVSITGSSNIKVHDNTISGAGLIPGVGPLAGVYVQTSNDVWIERNVFTSNGPAAPSNSSNGDIVTNAGAGSNRVHILHNQISGSITQFSILSFDCDDCEYVGNQIDQNNSSFGSNADGYGITVYGSVGTPRRARIIGNNIQNTAGSGIYLVTNLGATVQDNILNNVVQQQNDVSTPAAGISLNSCVNCSVGGNTITASTKNGISLTAPLGGTVVSGNTIKTTTTNGIRISGNITDATIANNIIDTAAAGGIYAPTPATLTRVKLDGNITRSTLIAIQVNSATDTSISGNILSAFTNYGILVSSGTVSKVNGNIVTSTNAVTGIDLTGTYFQVDNNTLHDFTGTAINLEATSTDNILTNNTIRSVTTAINTSAALRSTILVNKLLNNGTATTTAASDTVFLNTVDGTIPITGTGNAVAQTSPTLITPIIGVATGTSVNLNSASVAAVLRQTSGAGFTGLRIMNDINTAVRALEFDYSGSAYASSLCTGAVVGEAGCILTTGAYPLNIGTNNIARMIIDAVGNVSILKGLRTGTSAQTDLAGTCTLGTNCVITFTQTYTSAPVCVATDTTAAAAVKVVVTTTTATFTGTGTDVLNYVCVGRN